MGTIKDLNKAYGPLGFEVDDEENEDRFEHLRMYDALNGRHMRLLT
jgi:hypothetical protein